MLVRDLYFKIYNVPIKDVTIIEENPANQNSISGKVIYTLANEASIIFDGPIEIKDGTLYIVRGTVAKSIPVGTQITTHLVNFDASPGINNKDMKFPIVSPPVTVVEMSHSGPSITVTGPVNSYLTPNVINVTFTSSNISRVKIEACVNKTDCTTLANEVSITNPGSGTVSTSWRWEIAGSEPFVGPFGTKQIYIKVTDLASGVFDLADSYIYISSPTSAAASNGIASESASNVSKNQFASPFISGFQDLFLRLFGNR